MQNKILRGHFLVVEDSSDLKRLLNLCGVHADTLRSITFRLTYSALPWKFDRGGTGIMRTDWSELDRALAGRVAEKGLRTVRVVVSKFPNDDMARQCVRQSLSRTNAAGALQLPPA